MNDKQEVNEKSKIDLISYVEDVCNYKLSEYQKLFLRKVEDSKKRGSILVYVPPRIDDRLMMIQAINSFYSLNGK